MDLHKVEVLLRAIELGSFSKAAEEFLYTPSALSHMADAIEAEIGVKIIQRTHGGIVVENPEMIEKLQQMLKLRREIDVLASKQQKKDCVITVATYASLSKYMLPGIIQFFRAAHPEIKVNVLVVNSYNEMLENGEADLLLGENIPLSKHVWQPILQDSYMAIFPKNSTLCALEQNAKYNESFIMPFDSRVEDYVSKENFKEIISVKSFDDSSIIQMVKTGMGGSVLSNLSLIGSENDVRVLPLHPPLCRTIGLLYKKNCSKQAKLFAECFFKE